MADGFERRLAAVLAGDIVGFSRMMHEDEDGTLIEVQKLFAGVIGPNIAEHGGRVVKTMGDGFIAEFSSVVSAFEAGRAVLSIVEPPMAMRLGLHVGDIIAQPDGDVMGNGVNVAARLEGMAKPGRMAISGRAAEELRRKRFALAYLGSRKLKNIAEPMAVYEFGGGGRRRRFGWISPIGAAAVGSGLVALAFAGWGAWTMMAPGFSMEEAVSTIPCSWLRVTGHTSVDGQELWSVGGFASMSPEAIKQAVLQKAVQKGATVTLTSIETIPLDQGQCRWVEKIKEFRYLGVPRIWTHSKSVAPSDNVAASWSQGKSVDETLVTLNGKVLRDQFFLYGIEPDGKLTYLGSRRDLRAPEALIKKDGDILITIITDHFGLSGVIALEADQKPPEGLVEQQVTSSEDIEHMDEVAQRDHWTFNLAVFKSEPMLPVKAPRLSEKRTQTL